MSLFGTSGIRRLVSKDFLKLAYDVGLAAGRDYHNIILGRDTRTSGAALKHAVTAGILASGAKCSDAGILPTPTLAFAAKQFDVGVMLTASHNPPEYNGIKLLNPDGSAFSESQQERIERAVQDPLSDIAVWDKFTTEEVLDTATEKHAEYIIRNFPKKLKIRVVVDCGGAAAYRISPYVLKEIGCEVIGLNCTPTGIFPHDVEPTEANLGDLMQKVKETHADLGIAHDGDADRMMAVDDKGRLISGDKMLAILAKASGSKKIVTTIDASMAIEEMGFETVRTKVGDPYVSEELKRSQLSFGGETSGAWVFPQISYCPDGIFAAAQITNIASRIKLSDLADSIPQYYLLRGSVMAEALQSNIIERRLAGLGPLSIDRIDGLKLNFKDGWLLIRPSGTEPKLRLTAEAKSEERARTMYDAAVKAISG